MARGAVFAEVSVRAAAMEVGELFASSNSWLPIGSTWLALPAPPLIFASQQVAFGQSNVLLAKSAGIFLSLSRSLYSIPTSFALNSERGRFENSFVFGRIVGAAFRGRRRIEKERL